MSDGPKKIPARVSFTLPEGQVPGVYANMLNVWHTEHEFTLDFAVRQQPRIVDDEATGQKVGLVDNFVVARVRIPAALLFAVLQALNGNLSKYEASFGPIRQPGEEDDPPLYPPDFGADDGDGGKKP